MQKSVFLDIDTQYAFMHKDGLFYVDGAEKIIPNLKSITQFAKRRNIRIISSIDRHNLNDNLSVEKPNSGRLKIDGFKKIPETSLGNSFKVSNKKLSIEKIRKVLLKNNLLIEKNSYSIFSNPNAMGIIQNINKCYVYGIATEFCVKETALDLMELGIEVFIITDAIRHSNNGSGKKTLKLLKSKGARFLTTKQLLSKKIL